MPYEEPYTIEVAGELSQGTDFVRELTRAHRATMENDPPEALAGPNGLAAMLSDPKLTRDDLRRGLLAVVANKLYPFDTLNPFELEN